MYLSDITIGNLAKIDKISEKCKIKTRLFDMGFVKGTEVKVLFSAPFDGPMEILIRGYKIVIRRSDARLISVL